MTTQEQDTIKAQFVEINRILAILISDESISDDEKQQILYRLRDRIVRYIENLRYY